MKLCDFGLARTVGTVNNSDNELHEVDSERKSDETTSPEMSSPEIKKFNKKIQVIFESDEMNGVENTKNLSHLSPQG